MKNNFDKTKLLLSAEKAVQSGSCDKKEKIKILYKQNHTPISGMSSYTNNLPGIEPILGELFNLIDTAVYVTNEDNYIVDVNEACCKILGYSKEELIGNNMLKLLLGESQLNAPTINNTRTINSISTPIEWKAMHKDGTVLYLTLSTKQLLHTNGRKYKINSLINITQQKTVLSNLQQSENKYRSVFENPLTAFFFTKPTGQILDANEAAVNIFGYSVDEFKLLGRDGIFDTADPNYLRLLTQRENEGKVKGTSTGIRKNGEYFPCELSSVLFRDTNDEIRSCVILIDISERIKVEQQNSLILDNTEENFVVIDKDFNILSFNKHFQKAYGSFFGKEVIKGNSFLDYTFTDQIENLKIILNKVFAGEKEKNEIDITLLNGEVITIETLYKPIKDQNGNISAVFINSIDITEKKQAERKFIKSKKRYKTLIENGHDVVAVLSSQAKALYISASVNDILGYKKTNLTSKDFFLLIHPDDSSEFNQQWQKTLSNSGTKILNNICRLLHEDGSYRWIEYTFTNMLEDSSIEGVILNFRDISEKVAATEKIRQSEANLKAIFDNTDEGFALIDSNFIVKACNANGRQNNFMMNAFKVGDNIMEFIEGPRKEFFKTIIEKVLGGESIHYERTATHVETNEPLWLSFSVNPVKVDGEIKSVCITGRDVTERKKKDFKIEQTKNLLKRAESIAHIGSIEVDYETNKRIWSDEFFRILGLKPGTIEPSLDGFVQFLHPDDKELYLYTLNKKLNEKNPSGQIETRIIRADGVERNIMAYAQAEYNKDGKLTKMLGVIKDTTEQKEIERKITQTQQLLNSAEKIAGIGSAEINLSTGKRIWSDQFYKIVGLEPGTSSPSAEGIVQFLHPDEKEAYLKWLHNGLANKIETQRIESRIINTNGEIRDIMAYGTAKYDANGKAETVIGVIQDITEMKKMEQELAVNREIYQSLFYQNPAAVFSLDMEGNLISANHILSLKSGCSEKELLQLHYSAFIHPGDIETANLHFENTKLGMTQEYEMRIITPHGSLFFVSLINLPIIVNNHIIGVYCIANDITQEKEAAILLKNTLADRQRILDYSLDVICEFDRKGNFLQVSKACKDLWGCDAEELIGTLFMDLVHEEDKASSRKKIKDIIEKEIPTRHFENRCYRKDGSIVTVIWSARWDANTKILYCIAKDGTETKAQEKALGLSEQLYRNLFNNNPLPLFIFDFLTHQIIEVNEAALKKYGYNKNEFLQLTIKDLRPQSEILKMKEMLKDEVAFENVSSRTWIHKKKNGELMHMVTTGNIIDYNGRRCVISLLNDITEKIKAESQKEFERRDKEALINTTDDQIWSVSKDLKFIAGNNAFINSFKSVTGKIIKQGDYLLLKESYSTELLLFWHEMYYRALGGESFTREIVAKESFVNEPHWKEINFKPIYNGKEISGVACYSRDITENKLYQNQLITINKKLETAQQIALLGYWEVDLQNNTVFFSDELYHILGFTKTNKKLQLQQILDAIHPDDRELVSEHFTLTVEQKRPFNYEHRIVLKDGTVKVLVQKGNLAYNDQGIAVSLEGTSQDITFRKKAEEAVKESEEKYRMIFNSNPLPNWIYDLETLQILEVNDAAITHYGYTKKEFLNMSIKDILVLEEIEDFVKLNKNIKSYGLLNFGQWQHAKKSSKKINVAITGHTIQYNNKNAVMIVSNDITEIMQSQQALAKSIERFEYATKATSDAIWDYDLTNNTIYWGEGFNTLFGYKMRERRPGVDSWEAFIHPEDCERTLQSITEIINDPTKIYWKGEYRFRKFDGNYTTVSDSALVVRDDKGYPYRIIGAMQDITERIQKEIVLKELNGQLNTRAVQLATSNAELEQFAYIASHDLQEPLRMVTSFLSQIQKKYEPQLDEAGQVYIRFAVDGAVRMRQIILDLLEYSRVGRQQYQFEKIDTREMLKEAFRMYTNVITEKKILVSYESVPDIIAAKMPIQQLFQNLIGNAIKYQQPGNIPEIKISATDNIDHWQFTVADNGIGIDQDYFNKIFVIFQRLHSKDEYSGTGIGLAICKKIIDNHQGKIWVESTPGKGSTFFFTIPKILMASEIIVNSKE